MFCEKCGTALEEGALYCAGCGAQQASVPVEGKKQRKKGFLIVILILLAVVATFGIYHALFNVNASPERVAAAYIESAFEKDYHKLLKCYPDCVVRRIADDVDLPENASRRKIAKSLKEQYATTEKQDYRIVSIEIEEQGDKSDFYIFRELYDMTKEEYNSISEAAMVEVELEDEDGDEYTMNVLCIEMDSKWYALIRI